MECLSLAAVPSRLLTALGASNFDVIYLRNQYVSTVAEVASLESKVIKKNNLSNKTDDQNVNTNSIIEYEISLHPVVTELLVLASIHEDKSTEKGDVPEDAYVFVNRSSSNPHTRNTDSMTAYIQCIHLGRVYRIPFKISVVPYQNIQDISTSGTTHKPIVHANVYISDDGFENIEFLNNVERVQERIYGRVITKGSIIALDTASKHIPTLSKKTVMI